MIADAKRVLSVAQRIEPYRIIWYEEPIAPDNLDVMADMRSKKVLYQTEEKNISINGHNIQIDIKESLCESCGDLCGDTVDCRVWIYQGREYTVPPKSMIIDCIQKPRAFAPGFLF